MNVPVKLPISKIALARAAIAIRQGGVCAICGTELGQYQALDHDHQTGYIRGVLCTNCNGIEGKVFNLARRACRGNGVGWWLNRLLEYYTLHSVPRTKYIHPTHRTPEQKRAASLVRAKRARAAKKLKG